ncbi:MAG: CHAT domain-containing protein [Bacteroidota bacterium]
MKKTLYFIITISFFALNAHAQMYLKKENTTPEQQKEYARIDLMPDDSLRLGWNRYFKLYKETGNRVNLYFCNNYANELIRRQNSFDPSLFGQLRDIARQNKDTINEEYATIYAEEALYHFYKRKKEKSQKLNAKAYRIYKKSDMGSYLPLVNMAYKIGYLYETMTEYEKARKYATLCIEDAKKHNIPVLEAASYITLTKMTSDSDPSLALDLIKKGLKIANEKEDNFIKVKANLYLYAINLLKRNNKDNQQIISTIDSAMRYEKLSKHILSQPELKTHKAIALNNMGESKKATEIIEEVKMQLNDSVYKNLSEHYMHLQQLGNAYEWIGNYEAAKDYYEKSAYEYLNSSSDKDYRKYCKLINDMLPVYLELNEYSKFDSTYRENKNKFWYNHSLDSAVNNLNYAQLNLLSTYLKFGIHRLSKAPDEEFKTDSLITLYESANKVVNTIFTRFDFNTTTINKHTHNLNECSDHIFNSGKVENMTEDQKKKIWLLASTSKAFDLINKKSFRDNEAESAKYRRLKARYKTTDESDSLYDKYFDEYIDYVLEHQLSNIIRKDNPYDPQMLAENYRKTKALLNKSNDDFIIDIYRTDSTISFFTLSNGNLDYHDLPLDHDSRNEMSRLVRDIKTFSYQSNSAFKAIEQKMNELLNKKEGITNISIIADEELLMFPFELVKINNDYLIKNYQVNYHYSPFLLYESKQKTRNKFDELLAVAPVFNNSDSKTAVALRTEMKAFDEQEVNSEIYRDEKSLKKLPQTKNEVTTINKLFQKGDRTSRVLLNDQATEKSCRENISDYDIIHFATHGYSSSENSGLSRLILSRDTSASQVDEKNDAYLHLNETYELSLNADLVVLSACKTGSGKIIKSEGIMALPRGFIYAGVPNVIASLWKVHDEKTKGLMVAFYKHLLEGDVSYAEALRQAKLDCIEKGFSPMDWAGFVLLGS